MKDIKTPTTLEECYTALDDIAPEDFDRWVKDDESTALAKAHHGLGRTLRNEWGLWEGSELKIYFENLGLHHADDMSGVILTSYHRLKNNKDIKVNEQVQQYKDFWAKNKVE